MAEKDKKSDKKEEKFEIDFEKLKKKFEEISESESGNDKSNENDEGSDESSRLEKSLDLRNENFNFNQISWPSLETDDSAPVLEKIAGEQAGPVFVGTISQSPTPGTSSETNGKDEMKYLPDFNTGDEPKYVSNHEKINTRPERVDFSRVGKEQINPTGTFQEAPSAKSYTPNVESPTPEKAFRPERFDMEKAGRENPLEKKESEFKKYKPNLPDKNY